MECGTQPSTSSTSRHGACSRVMVARDAAPYFDEPFYVGYDVGGFELGLWPAGDPSLGPVAYWGVDDIDAALAHVLSLGATQRGEVSDVGERIRMVELTAPMGDVFGLIENPNFVAAAAPATYDGPGR